jgi:hypothetical protein
MRIIALLFCLLPMAGFANEEPLRITSAAPTAVAGTTLTLQLIDLVDQRCPDDADCYWEGMVQAKVQVVDGTNAPITITLCNLCEGADADATVGPYTITLGYLYPSKHELAMFGRPAILADYSLSLDVTF